MSFSLQLVRFLDERVGEVVRQFEGFIFIEAVLGDEVGQECAINAPSHIVPSGNGEESPGIVVEAYGVVEAGGLRRLLAETHHAFRTVMKPPWRTEAQARIMASERSQFAADRGLVEHEEDDGEFGLGAEAVEQG